MRFTVNEGRIFTMKYRLNHVKSLFIVLLLAFIVPGVSTSLFADDAKLSAEEAKQIQQDNIQRQLTVLKDSIKATEKEIAKLEAKIPKAKDEASKNKLVEKKTKALEKLDELHLQFEASVTGGVRLSDYDKKEEDLPFDWQSEVLEIFKPMIAELKSLTELPREIEALKSEIAMVNQHLPVAQKAVEQITAAKEINTDKASADQLKKLENDWKNRQDDLINRLQLLTFQLDEKLNPPKQESISITEKLGEFASGRGLTIVLTIGTFIVFFLVFTFFAKIVEEQITREKESQPQFIRRLMRILLQVMAVLLSLFAAMLVLYLRGDWLILGVIFLILIGVAWGLRQSAPKYIHEAKLLLNLGPVREGERVIYNGLPWRVKSLNMFSTLVNPALTGGSLRLPVSDIVGLRSRKFSDDEGWFPCNPGDFVILDDGVFGSVLKQTPEIVQMPILGGSTKTYSTGTFLGLNPRNISHGFGVFVTFGLDYNLQSSITDDIPKQLESELRVAISESGFVTHLKSMAVEFKAASASSLDLVIVTLFNGEAAGDYFAIDRFLQKASVEICTRNDWNIPFENMTVHLDKID